MAGQASMKSIFFQAHGLFRLSIRLAERAFPILCIGIVCATVYDMCHPNSHPAFSTVAVMACTALLAVLLLRYNFIRQPRSTRVALIVLTATGFCLRLLPILFIQNEQISDFQTYSELAGALCNGKGFAYTGRGALTGEVKLFLNRYDEKGPVRTAFRPPGAPLLFASVYSITGQKPVWGKALNAVLGTLIGLFIFLLLYPENPTLAFRSSLLWQIYPSAIISTNLIGTEIPFTACILLSAVFLKNGLRAKVRTPTKGGALTILWSALAGLCIGYASLIRPAALFLMLCGIWSILASPHNFRKSIPAALVFTLGMSIPLILWGVRNYKAFGVFEMQTTQIGIVSWQMTRNIISPQEEQQYAPLDKKMHTSTDEFELSRIGMEIGTKRLMIAAHKISFVKLLLLNHCKGWNHDYDALEWVSLPSEHAQAPPLSAAVYGFLKNSIQVFYLCAVILAVFGGCALRRLTCAENPGLLMLIFYLLVSSALLCVFQGQTRYHFPLMPVIFICASQGIGLLQRKIKS